MEQGIITGALAISLALLNPSSATYISTSQTIVDEVRSYAVKETDTLSKIAEAEYGSFDYWTVVWNDNPWIENPNNIKKGWVLKVRKTKLAANEELKPELKEKMGKSVINAAPAYTQAQTATPTQPTAHASAPTYSGGPLTQEQIIFLGNCEAGMNPARNSGNGYYGAFQFSYGTWKSMGTAYERADLAPIEVQIEAVQRLLQRSSIYHQFPGCARKMQTVGLL